jgi:hypothetical protein
MVQHQPGRWVEARVEKQWCYEGRWRLSVYYYVGIGMQYYRVYDADQCRPVGSGAESRTMINTAPHPDTNSPSVITSRPGSSRR